VGLGTAAILAPVVTGVAVFLDPLRHKSGQGDFILDQSGVKLFVDMFSAQYLNGVKIDYVTGVMGSGFTFTNPNATGSCGCGTSFTA